MALCYRLANFYPLTLLLKNFAGASDFVLGAEGRGRYHFIIKYKNAAYFIFDHKEKGIEGKLKVTLYEHVFICLHTFNLKIKSAVR